jgi:ABC-type polysaccharide/polyol phosphate export permease
VTATSLPRTQVAAAAPPHERQGNFLSDVWVIARRGLLHMKREPEALSDATIQPIMFVLLFAYVFGGAIDPPGDVPYREFLMGGIFAQTIVFSAFGPAISIANDMKNNAHDRFRSLPIAKGAVLGGHAVASMCKAVLPIVLMSVCGYIVGWRIQGGILDAVAGYALMLAFSFAMVWVGILLGAIVRTPEGVTGVAFAALFPITFIASVFVPIETMPDLLATVARWNPTTTLADSRRLHFGNVDPRLGIDGPGPFSPVVYTWLWIIGVLLLAAPAAVKAHQRAVSA